MTNHHSQGQLELHRQAAGHQLENPIVYGKDEQSEIKFTFYNGVPGHGSVSAADKEIEAQQFKFSAF